VRLWERLDPLLKLLGKHDWHPTMMHAHAADRHCGIAIRSYAADRWQRSGPPCFKP
jgi:hypothetical protein